MIPTPELIAQIQRDRERHIEQDRLACLAMCAKGCCTASVAERVTRFLRDAAHR
jgi:hypothetical protein